MNDRRPSLDARLAYATLRAILGLNIFLHGLVRVPSLSGFADGLVQGFSGTILPAVLVRAFAYALVPLEVVVGALVLVGWKTRWALVAGQLVMAALVFGTALRQDWGTLGTQMIYVGLYSALLAGHRYNGFAVDTRSA
jgi:thiosulfate dehydrogenase [quinone] large subunit